MNLVDQRFQTVRELNWIHVPITQTCVIVRPLAVPPVIHDESLHADARCLLGESLLPRLIDFEVGSLPGVIDDGSQLRIGRVRNDAPDLEAVQQPRRTSDAFVRVSAVKVGRIEVLSRSQTIAEVEAVRSRRNPHLLELVLFDTHLPGAAPRKGAEPGVSRILVVHVVSVDRKPWIVLATRRSPAAFEKCLAWLNQDRKS